MPPRKAVEKLPSEIRAQLDERLRESCYSDLRGHVAWLEEQGETVSVSAIGRYSVDLKLKDRAASSIARDMRDDLTDRQAVDLLLELGALRVKEQRILARLEEIGYMKWDNA